jgi:hypothetical protein
VVWHGLLRYEGIQIAGSIPSRKKQTMHALCCELLVAQFRSPRAPREAKLRVLFVTNVVELPYYPHSNRRAYRIGKN